MAEVNGIRVTVTEGDDTLLDVTLDEPCALFGSGSHCDIQLGPELVAHEHLLIEVRAGGIFVDILATRPAVTVNGTPFQGGRVLEDSTLSVGKLGLRVVAVEGEGGKGKQAESPLQKGIALLITVVVVAGAGGLIGLRGSKKVGEAPKAPALFTDVGDPVCPETSADAARLAAREFLVEAEGQHERAFFDVSDAVRAVLSYGQAAACLAVAGDRQEARRVLETKKRFAQDAERVYHLHQVRLHRAITLGEHEEARVAVDTLIKYLANSHDPYVAWLDKQRRTFHARTETKNARKK